MEKETRSAIERATQKARAILEIDFAEQLAGEYDVMIDGQVAERPGAHLGGRQKALRARIVASVRHKLMTGMAPKEAVADYLRDAAFTTLNRFVALKMLEARGLVQECITKGEASSGFVNEYLAFAPGAKFSDGSGYQLYIESIFDELSTEIKVLFDRRDPAAAMWPRKATFDELLAILNASELREVWGEDETIGWVYQYFNSGDERRKMRDESQAPRNSRELAIRNQFFTPSYVVQFLSDNTLGRIWYEMRKGDTKLVEACEFMIRRDGEVFADVGELVVEGENVVRHRPLKDPRDLRIIDPACGSGHFLLYCFFLLVNIYQEAWHNDDGVVSEATGNTLRVDYPNVLALRHAIPSLILRHNLHGVDIDPRCAQIAQLALWMRAQRAYQDLEIHRADRPIIRRSNIVIAEPMPGDSSLVDEFAASLNPPILGHLFKEIVREMKLAGEMGSLLPIERQVAYLVHKAKDAYVNQERQSAQGFLPGLAPHLQQAELDLSGIDDDAFFEQAEDKIFATLKVFVADAVNGVGVRRRLFADDAEQGIALIDISRKRFDAVLMNPPFGAPSTGSKSMFEELYPHSRSDLLMAFVERGIAMLHSHSRLGAITSRTPFFLSGAKRWREDIVLALAPPLIFLDLGAGVLDSAMVETSAYCLEAAK
ncbi:MULTISPECIES: Eco57I restriction-modification methylase domain-containing protein [unclassified Rhizobium]|uniref:Eco57I restriction-modification methylase domain-containing protein n=1 Tax=unclassified Rhizobium TaxID=2613769 RepID=UPI00288BDC66|nr:MULTISPECIES: DNA methyltransferase [unclassified Rhizobium]